MKWWMVSLAAFATLTQQPQRPTFRAVSNLVTIDVVVTVDGDAVGGLQASDFVLTDNGVVQTIDHIEQAEVPAEVTIIMDVNYMVKDSINNFSADIGRIVSYVRPTDTVRLMTFDTQVRDQVLLTAPADMPAVERLVTNDLASAHDALAAALMRHHATDRRHLIIAVTNGVDTSSVTTLRTLEAIAKRASATLHIVTPDLSYEPPKIELPPRLTTLF